MGAVTRAVQSRALTVRPVGGELITRERGASPTRLPEGAAATAAYTWDGRVAVPNPRIYRHWAKSSEWVRGAISIRRSQVSSAEWDIVPYDQRRPYSKRQQDRIRDLFRTPNPSNDSYRTFIEPVIEDLLTLDAGCVEKVRNLNGDLLELWPVDGAQVKVDALWAGNPDAARYFWYPDGFNETARWKNADFIYMIGSPRTDSPIGLPPLETLRATVEAEMAAHEYNRRQVENAAPDGIINLGEGFTEQQVNRFREFFESEVAGRGPLGFIGGSKDPGFIKFRDSNRDQQFLEWQIYLVRKIAVVFGLTPQDLGVTFDVNRSTSEIQLQVSEDRGLRPLMSLLQEYLTEECVWDAAFGGQANNLAFRFTALNLKESTAKAAIYEKALAGTPWRYINEARIDEGREPIAEMEGKLVMETPQGALDISDVPTVREYLEMQMASKAAAGGPPPTKDAEIELIRSMFAELGRDVRAAVDARRDAPPPTVSINKGAFDISVEPTPVNINEGAISLTVENNNAPTPPAAISIEPAPVQASAAPIVNVEPAQVHLDTSSFAAAIRELKEVLKREPTPVGPPPVVRREVRRDKAGRITEVIDHRGE